MTNTDHHSNPARTAGKLPAHQAPFDGKAALIYGAS